MWTAAIYSLIILCRHDSEDVLDLLTMLAGDSDFSSDSEEEDEMELLYIELAFSLKRERGPRLNMDDCSKVDFELFFRYVTIIQNHGVLCVCVLLVVVVVCVCVCVSCLSTLKFVQPIHAAQSIFLYRLLMISIKDSTTCWRI